MAHKQPCAKYQYVVTPSGPKILPVDEPSCKDEESPADYNVGGYLPVKVNDTFRGGRYRVVRKLGWGHFSTVWLVKDIANNCHSALKVVKSAGRYAETARDEIKLLTHVSSFSPQHLGRQHIVSFFDSFCHQGPESSHVCIVFEPLGENLLALIERNKKKGVPKALVKVITKQILLGLQYLHDECDLVHTDIKPENILISIPDIEAHINIELAQSSSPTSRRVGVPLPTKSRGGVSIPYNPQRARRQVQIFDSQPLSSPGRSWGRSAGQRMTSAGSRPNESGSGANSVPGSFFAQMHISRLTGSNSDSLHSVPSGSVAGPCSSIPKVSSGLSSYATCAQEPVRKVEKKPVDPSPHPALAPAPIQSGGGSPSTSSSSSSISSTMVSTTAASSSMTNTPPTSLSNSIGNVVAGFIGLAKVATEVNARLVGVSPHERVLEFSDERVGVPVKGAKGKEREAEETGPQNPISASWKVTFGLSSSWKEKVSSSLGSLKSNTSAGFKPQLMERPDQSHTRSSSGIVTSNFWKDPGTAAPAPAVVVSAVVSADGQENTTVQQSDFFPLPDVLVPPTKTGDSAFSESSSVTATPVRHTPTGTPLPLDAKKTKSDRSDQPSLLTQTAPIRMSLGPKRALPRVSPPKQISQLSAHMLTRHPPSASKSGSSRHSSKRMTKSRTTTRSLQTQPPPNTTNTTSTCTASSPSAPPPTPTTPPTTSYFSQYFSNFERNSCGGGLSPEDIVPPISVKIADLGNATPSTKHFTEDIQTRQYRAPEAILGRRDWDARADIWSIACVVFELLTAEYLFDPQGQGELFTKDDDHMAQIIELVGDFPTEIKMGGKYSRELFDHTGALRYIRTLKPWPLKRVMIEKYSYTEAEATELCSFLDPMLAPDMRDRKHARDLVDHSWLMPREADGIVTEW